MALIGCEWFPSPPKIDQKLAPPTQEIALFLQRSTRTSMASPNKRKKF